MDDLARRLEQEARINAEKARARATRYGKWWHFGMWRHECRELQEIAIKSEGLAEKFRALSVIRG